MSEYRAGSFCSRSIRLRGCWLLGLILAVIPHALHGQGTAGNRTLVAVEVPAASFAEIDNYLNTLWQNERLARFRTRPFNDPFTAPCPSVTLAFVALKLRDDDIMAARQALEKATKHHPDFIDGWLLQSYLRFRSGTLSQAVTNLILTINAIEQANLTEQQRERVYFKVGQLMGFAQGPMVAPNKNIMLAGVPALLTQNASPNELASFERGVEEVLTIFAEQSDPNEKARIAEQLAQKINDQKEFATLTNRHKKVAREILDKERGLQRLNREFEREQASFDADVYRLRDSMDSNWREAASLQEVLRLRQQRLFAAATSACPDDRERISDIQSDIRCVRRDIDSLVRDRRSLERDLRDLNKSIRQEQGEFRDRISAAEEKLADVRREFAEIEDRLAEIGPVNALPPGHRNLNPRRSQPISIYVEMNPESLRQDLLDAIQKPAN